MKATRKVMIALEKVLRHQHLLKELVRKDVIYTTRNITLLSALQLSKQFKLSQNYIRKKAWEWGLDPFPGHINANNIWMCLYLVTHVGYTPKEAGDVLGYTADAVRKKLRHYGWQPYTVWGRAAMQNRDQRFLVVPEPLAKHFQVRISREDESSVMEAMENGTDYQIQGRLQKIGDPINE